MTGALPALSRPPATPGEVVVPLAAARLSQRSSTAPTPDGAARAAAAWLGSHLDSDLCVVGVTLGQSGGRWSAQVEVRERLSGAIWRHVGRSPAGDSRTAAARAVTNAVIGEHGLAVAGLRRLVVIGAADYGIVIAPGPGAVLVGRPSGDGPVPDELADVLMAVPMQTVAEIDTDAGTISAAWMEPVAMVTVAAAGCREPVGRWVERCRRAAADGDLW